MFNKILGRSNSQTCPNGFQSFSGEIDSIISSDNKEPQLLAHSGEMPVSLVRSNRMPKCLNRSSYNEDCYDESGDISFEKGGRVNVETKEGSVTHKVRDYKSIKRAQSTLLAVATGTQTLNDQSQQDKPHISDQKIYPENDENDINHRISDELPKIKPSKPVRTRSHSMDLAPKLTKDLECSYRLISRKMEICHRAQIVECQVSEDVIMQTAGITTSQVYNSTLINILSTNQNLDKLIQWINLIFQELCSLYETVSRLDFQMTFCKDQLTQALKSKDKER